MKVLHVLDHSLPQQSGYVYRTLNILKAQRSLGWQTYHLTSPKHGPAEAPEETVDGWHFHRTPQGPATMSSIWNEVALMRATARRIDEVVRTVKPTAIHAHSPLLNGYPALWVARRHRLPVVYEVRAFWEDAAVDQGTASEGGLRYRATRALETHLMRRVDAVVPICNGLHADIAARGISESKLFIVRNFVDLSHFKEHYPIDSELRNNLRLTDCTVLGFIGSFYPYEGLIFLLQAVTRLFNQRANVKLLLVGGGPQAARIEQEIAQQGLSERIIMTGRVPHEEIDRYYDLVDILVYPRRRMRLTEIVTPIKLLEAMAKGKNLLASDVGGHREIIVDQATGRLFDADSIDDFLLKVSRMLDDEQLLSRQSESARAHVARRHSVEMAAERYAHIFKSVLDLTAPRRSWLQKAVQTSLSPFYRKTS